MYWITNLWIYLIFWQLFKSLCNSPFFQLRLCMRYCLLIFPAFPHSCFTLPLLQALDYTASHTQLCHPRNNFMQRILQDQPWTSQKWWRKSIHTLRLNSSIEASLKFSTNYPSQIQRSSVGSQRPRVQLWTVLSKPLQSSVFSYLKQRHCGNST